jgi:hypothetical protein
MTSPSRHRFAVFFDTHYCLGADPALAAASAETDDLPRYLWMREHLFPSLLTELCSQAPEFCVCTGDLCEGARRPDAEVPRRELRDVFERFATAGLTVFNARGTHEPPADYAAEALPRFAAILGRAVSEPYFALDTPWARFVLLEYLTLEPGNPQAEWLADQCRSTPTGRPLFVFAHAPLANFARPGFSPEPMRQVLNFVFAQRSPTVFFCGHTHNQALSYHPTPAGGFVQIKGSSVGFPAAPLEDLARRHLLLLEPTDRYYWGVPEDVAPGYWLVDVGPAEVTAEWHGVGRGRLGRIRLSTDGAAPEVLSAPPFLDLRLRPADLPLLRHATLEYFMLGDGAVGIGVELNGIPLGHTRPNGGYAARRHLDLPQAALASLAAANQVKWSPAAAGSWLLGSVRLAGETYDGRRLTSPIVPRLLACGTVAERFAHRPECRRLEAGAPFTLDLDL